MESKLYFFENSQLFCVNLDHEMNRNLAFHKINQDLELDAKVTMNSYWIHIATDTEYNLNIFMENVIPVIKRYKSEGKRMDAQRLRLAYDKFRKSGIYGS